MTLINCGGCKRNFDMETVSGKYSYGIHHCPNCGGMVRSSRKELIENKNTGKLNIHSDLKKGDFI